jgi:hypothetical protein
MDQAALALFVEPCVQMLADSEVGDDLGRDFDCGAGSRVPARASLAMLEREDAKASYLDPSTPSKCVTDLLEDGFDNPLDIAWS